MNQKDKNLERLGKLIRQSRLKLGWSQEKLAFEANIDRSYVGSVERGERNISFINLCKLAKALSEKISRLTKDMPIEEDTDDRS